MTMRSIFFAFLPAFLFANYSPDDISKALKEASHKHEIDKKILYTLAKIESGFNPLIISFVSSKKDYDFKNLTKNTKKYKDKYLISLQGSEKDLIDALKILLRYKKLRVDVGLMQINSVNFSYSEIDHIFKPSYNINKSSEILKACKALKSNLKDSIECYNKGTGKYVKYDYYNRFKNSYVKDFSNISSGDKQ